MALTNHERVGKALELLENRLHRDNHHREDAAASFLWVPVIWIGGPD